ncbi:unnamed protein product, partial [Meganyctiphanes norvegica]
MMESEEYFRRMCEQNGAYNTSSCARTYSTPYGDKSSVFRPTVPVESPVNSAALAAAMVITQPIEQHQTNQPQLQPQSLDNHQQIHVHMQHQSQLHEQQPQSQLHVQQQHQQLNKQQQEQQILYKCNECGSSWGNLKEFRQHQRKHFNSPEEVHPPPPLNNFGKVSAISELQVSTSTNSDYIPDNFLSLMPSIPQRYGPEPHKIYPPEPHKTYPHEPPKTFNLESPVMYKPQPHIVFNSQHTKSFIQKPLETCVKLKSMESEFKNQKNSDKHNYTDMGENTENSFLNFEHSIFENEDGKTQDHYASNDSYSNNSDNSHTKEEIEKNISYFEAKLEENINLLKSLDKKRQPRVQKKKNDQKKVKASTDYEEPKPEDDSVIVSLVAETTPMLDVIRWFQQHQLIKSKMKCDHCEHVMSWETVMEMKRFKEGFYWKCRNRSCPKFNSKPRKSIIAGSVFERSQISLKKWLHIIYKWSRNVGVKAASEQINIGNKTMGQHFRFFRDICEEYFKENPIKLGGPGISIEFNVFSLSDSRHPLNRGAEKQPPIWVLAIVDPNCIPSIGYMEIVESRDVATLLPIIIKVVQLGSIIHTKEWRAYSNILEVSKTTKAVDHQVDFVDFNYPMHSKAIESYWKKHKSYLMAMKGIKKCALNSHLQEFMWRERFLENVLEIICEQISIQYSIDVVSDTPDSCHSMEEVNKPKKHKGEKLKENLHNLEEPPVKKCRSIVQQTQSSHSISQDSITQNKDSIKQEPSVSNASYIDNPEDVGSGEERENQIKYLKKDGNILEESPPKKCLPVVQQGRQCHRKIKKYTDNQEPVLECDSEIVSLFAETTPMLVVIRWFMQHQLLISEMK